MAERKIALIVEYCGTHYYGFQWQPNVPTIQDELEKAIRKLTGEMVRILAASRTDAGVHAKGQVVSFRTKADYPPETFVKALNYYLPADISVKGASELKENFDVRRDALSREYHYYVLNSPVRSPFIRDFAYLVTMELNIEAMKEASQVLIGEHDFASFASALGHLTNTTRIIYKASVGKEGRLVIFTMVANSFLPHQVRNTVGLLLKVGLGKIGLDEFRQIMDARMIGLACFPVSACGLYLMKVNYPFSLGG